MGREEDQATSINLRVCSIRVADGYDRRFCFEIISPSRYGVVMCFSFGHAFISRARLTSIWLPA
jgi:hypothetical protein